MPLNSQEDNPSIFINLPASKSIINRLLILNSINKKDLCIFPASLCNDVKEMLSALTYIGLEYTIHTSKSFPVKLTTHWRDASSIHQAIIIINEAGTVLRFLMTRLATEEGKEFTLIPGPSLQKRPIIELVNILNNNGADIEVFADHYYIRGRKLQGGQISVPANISSQYISSLMLSASLMNKPLSLHLDHTILSKSYIDMSIQLLEEHQVHCISDHNDIHVSPRLPQLKSSNYACEPDYSSAVYYWILSILTQKKLYIQIPDHESIQPDFQIIPILEQMGAIKEVIYKDQQTYLSFKKRDLSRIELSMSDMPDQVPCIALLAIFATNKTIIKNIWHLKYKESDRIEALVSEFSKLGVNIHYVHDQLEIEACSQLKTDVYLDSHHDHRMAMIFLILQKIYPEIKINDVSCVEKSAPEFLELIKTL